MVLQPGRNWTEQWGILQNDDHKIVGDLERRLHHGLFCEPLCGSEIVLDLSGSVGDGVAGLVDGVGGEIGAVFGGVPGRGTASVAEDGEGGR